MSIRAKLKKFAGSTTMHGASRAILSKSLAKRLIWWAILTAAWIMCIFNTYQVCESYFAYPIKVNVEVVYGKFPFPAVTFCNMRSLDFYLEYKLGNYFQSIASENTVLTDSPTDKFINEFTSYVNFAMSNINNSNFSSLARKIVLSKTVLAANIQYDVLSANAISTEEFFVTCKFHHRDCMKNITEFFNQYFFRCFTYTPNEVRLIEGASKGLSVIVLTGSGMLNNDSTQESLQHLPENIPGLHEANSPMSGSEGIRVVLHAPGTTPNPAKEGFDVPPGYSVSLAFKPRFIQRITKPHGDCIDQNPFYPDQPITKTGLYRGLDCERMCYQNRVITECNCYDNTLVSVPNVTCSNFDSSNAGHQGKFISQCSLRNSDGEIIKNFSACGYVSADCEHPDSACHRSEFEKQMKELACIRAVKEQNIKPHKTCKCLAPCNETEYDVAYSLSRWPGKGRQEREVYSEIFENNNYGDRFKGEKGAFYNSYMQASGRRVLGDFARINVFVADRKITKSIETPLYTKSQLISDVGGQLGVWVGTSIITLSEVGEFVLFCLVEFLRRRKSEGTSKETRSILQNGMSLKTVNNEAAV